MNKILIIFFISCAYIQGYEFATNSSNENHDQLINLINTQFSNFKLQLDKKFDMIDKKFEHIKQKFDMIDKKFEHIKQKFDIIDQRLNLQADSIQNLVIKIDHIDSTISGVKSWWIEPSSLFLYWILSMTLTTIGSVFYSGFVVDRLPRT
jgi:hypothetical protein